MEEKIDHWFRYHPATPETVPHYEAIRAAGRAFAEVIIAHTPEGSDRNAAIAKVRVAVMLANASVACGGR